MGKRKSTDIVQIKLRLAESLRKKLEGIAQAERRSLNAQINVLLEQCVDHLELLQREEESRRWDKVRTRMETERSGPQARPGPARHRLIESAASDEPEPSIPQRKGGKS
jgi:hypothetical protein